MIRHLIRSTLGNLRKNKLFSFINIFGLGIGLSSVILILIYVKHEYSYDNFANAKNVFRVQRIVYRDKVELANTPIMPGPLAPNLELEYPEIKDYTRLFYDVTTKTVEYNKRSYYEQNCYYVENSFLKIFSVELVKGNPDNALNDEFTVVISEDIAKKYFNNENPVGKLLRLDNRENYRITGVFKELSYDSHMKFDFLFSFQTLLNNNMRWAQDNWNWNSFYVYIELLPGTNPINLEKKFPEFLEKYLNEISAIHNVSQEYYLIPVKDIHLKSNTNNELLVNGNHKQVKVMIFIALLILVIAIINYTNLTISTAIEKANEIGIRKVHNASRINIIMQVLFETFLMNVISILLSVIIIIICIPIFKNIISLYNLLFIFKSFWFWGIIVFLLVFGSLLSGIYPSIIISSTRSLELLSKKISKSKGANIIRNFLLAFQLVISFSLLCCLFIVNSQMKYMKNKDLGFDKEDVLVIHGPSVVSDSVFTNTLTSLKEELLTYPEILNVANSLRIPGKQFTEGRTLNRINETNIDAVHVTFFSCSHEFLDLYKIKILAGRNFSKDNEKDLTESIIISKSTAEKLGFNSVYEAINEYILLEDQRKRIIGVIDNYHQMSLRDEFENSAIVMDPNIRDYFSIKLDGKNYNKAIKKVEGIWARFFPNSPFKYFFLEDYYNKQYTSEYITSLLLGIFSFISVFITCIGLLGIINYSLSKRIKEVGIRKVHGAQFNNIVFVISKGIVLIMIISAFISYPIAFKLGENWLSNYPFRTDMSVWFFVYSSLIIVFVSLFIISFNIIKTTLSNPINSLRYE